MTEPSSRLRLTKRQKLRSPLEFRRVYESGSKAGDGFLLVFGLPNDLGVTRLGLSVSKKNGSAVIRNRIKRQLREAFRLEQAALPAGWDFVLVPRLHSGATLADDRRSLIGCVRRVLKRHPQPAQKPTGGPESPSLDGIAPHSNT